MKEYEGPTIAFTINTLWQS